MESIDPDRQSLASVRQRAHRDFGLGWSEDCRVELITLGPDADSNIEALDDPDSWRSPDGETVLILRIANNFTDVTSESRVKLEAEVMSLLQDKVVDETGLPWPELSSGRVLDVAVRDGEAVWRNGTDAVCRIGELNRQTLIR